MFRKMLAVCCAVALLGLAGKTLGEEVKGKVKEVDIVKNTITITVGDKDKTLDVPASAKITTLGKGKGGGTVDVPGGIMGISAGADVSVTTDKDSTVTAIRISPEVKKKK
jgi:hypothetical protein